MIEVTKHGKKKFTATCANCGCEFTYELSDRNGFGGVDCPDCGHYVAHQNFANNNGGLYYPPNCRKIDDTNEDIVVLALRQRMRARNLKMKQAQVEAQCKILCELKERLQKYIWQKNIPEVMFNQEVETLIFTLMNECNFRKELSNDSER